MLRAWSLEIPDRRRVIRVSFFGFLPDDRLRYPVELGSTVQAEAFVGRAVPTQVNGLDEDGALPPNPRDLAHFLARMGWFLLLLLSEVAVQWERLTGG